MPDCLLPHRPDVEHRAQEFILVVCNLEEATIRHGREHSSKIFKSEKAGRGRSKLQDGTYCINRSSEIGGSGSVNM